MKTKRNSKLQSSLFASIFVAAAWVGLSSSMPVCLAGEPHQWFAGTYLDPAIQRPDFFPHTFTRSIPEYRQVYNRPRNLTGWIAYKIEPSSQEAMAWQTNHCNGNYQNNAGPYIPMYCYPKPWESLNTRGRPGSQASVQSNRIQDVRIDSEPMESIPGTKLKPVPEATKDFPFGLQSDGLKPKSPLGVEVPPPAAALK